MENDKKKKLQCELSFDAKRATILHQCYLINLKQWRLKLRIMCWNANFTFALPHLPSYHHLFTATKRKKKNEEKSVSLFSRTKRNENCQLKHFIVVYFSDMLSTHDNTSVETINCSVGRLFGLSPYIRATKLGWSTSKIMLMTLNALRPLLLVFIASLFWFSASI